MEQTKLINTLKEIAELLSAKMTVNESTEEGYTHFKIENETAAILRLKIVKMRELLEKCK